RDNLPVPGFNKTDVPVIGELELGYLFCAAPIVAITGTNGKTTVTSLIGEIFTRSGRDTVVCGNIGNPFTGEIGRITPKSSVVLEVSSFQLDTIVDFSPRVAVLLNVTDDHYDRHKGFESYKLSKFRIFMNQKKNDFAVIHSDFKLDAAVRGIKSRVVFYGGEGDRYRAENDRVVVSSPEGEKVFVTSKETDIKGKHNMENIACCCQVAELEGISPEVVRSAVTGFKGLEHRFQKVNEFKGLVFIDDSKATNVDATKRALESVDRRVVLIAGGRDKLGDYSVVSALMRDKVSAIVVIGEARENIKRAFSSVVPVYEAESMNDAVKKAVSAAKSGEAVMLSPMCSSFDMFESYAHRGRVFREAVRELSGTGR
ncbi:MAG TPA: UDP-N-acetylmuramoyl-L-alanine--D-glutamate ligase, partial [Candidatus Omnitrophota bacterium]|nr:UDP-N-acetylmuramoyl-L-alanine--D-glutamate ligase [Candidatus Omnitrophota bacterium]